MSSIPGRSGGRIFFSRVNFLCGLLSGVRSTLCYHSGTLKTPVILPNMLVAGYTYTYIHPWPNKIGVGWLCCPCRHNVETYQGNELTCNSSGNTQPQSSQIVEQLWTDAGLKMELVCTSWYLLLNEWSNPPQKFSQARKSHHRSTQIRHVKGADTAQVEVANCLPLLGLFNSVFWETDHVLDLNLCLDVFLHGHNLWGSRFLLSFLKNVIAILWFGC